MNPDMERFLNLKTHPERLSAEQAAWMLGYSPHEIPMLIAKNLLKPLGHPSHNGPKHFLTSALEDLRRDEKWHGKAVDAVMEYWRTKNEKKPDTARHSSRLQTQIAVAVD
jgi:hypothetical protein